MPIADLAGVIKNASDQLFTDLVAPEVRPDVQPLQLAALLVQLPQADAARQTAVPIGQIQAALRHTVLALRALQFLFVVLEDQVLPDGGIGLHQHVGVLCEQRHDLLLTPVSGDQLQSHRNASFAVMLLFYPDAFRGARLFCFDIRVNKWGGGDGKSCVKRRLTNVRKVYIIASIKGKGVLESDLLDAFLRLKTSI